MHLPPAPVLPAPTAVHFTVVRHAVLPLGDVQARFRLTVQRSSLPAAVAFADTYLEKARRHARTAGLRFVVRSYFSQRRVIYTPGPHPRPPRTVYAVESRFDLRGPASREAVLTRLAGRLAGRAYLLSLTRVSAMTEAARRRLVRALDARVLRRVRRDAVRDCRLLGDTRATVHSVVLSHEGPTPPRPRPLFPEAMVAPGIFVPPPVTASAPRLTARAQAVVWCERDGP